MKRTSMMSPDLLRKTPKNIGMHAPIRKTEVTLLTKCKTSQHPHLHSTRYDLHFLWSRTQHLGVSTVAQQDRCYCSVSRMQLPSSALHSVLKDPALLQLQWRPQLWLRSDSPAQEVPMLQCGQKRKKKKKKRNPTSRNNFHQFSITNRVVK